MKQTYTKWKPTLATLFIAVVATVSVFGQEDRNSEFEPIIKPVNPVREISKEGENSIPTTPGEGRSLNTRDHSSRERDKDSVAVTLPTVQPLKQAPATTKPVRPAEGRNQKEEDPSVLSFNFLYYIIQKYKLSDIID
jgi:hypothetical protein